MKKLAPLALLAVAAPLAAANAPQHLAGVSDRETAVPSGGVMDFHRGNGDVLFVSDHAGRWYRLGLNEGCLRQAHRIDSIAFGIKDGIGRVDHFTTLMVRDVNGARGFSCNVNSIRRSEAPPQINSKSPVTLD
jgi:hypothetical protein